MAKSISEKDLRRRALKDPEVRTQLKPIKRPPVKTTPEAKQLQAVETLLKIIQGGNEASRDMLMGLMKEFLGGVKAMRETIKVDVAVPEQPVPEVPKPITGFKVVRDSNRVMTDIKVVR